MTRTERENRFLQEAFVAPFYLQLLHCNFMHDDFEQSDAFRSQITAAAGVISDDQLRHMLRVEDWREHLTAGWMVGLSKRSWTIAAGEMTHNI
jgi:hypothetical protein